MPPRFPGTATCRAGTDPVPPLTKKNISSFSSAGGTSGGGCGTGQRGTPSGSIIPSSQGPPPSRRLPAGRPVRSPGYLRAFAPVPPSTIRALHIMRNMPRRSPRPRQRDGAGAFAPAPSPSDLWLRTSDDSVRRPSAPSAGRRSRACPAAPPPRCPDPTSAACPAASATSASPRCSSGRRTARSPTSPRCRP